MDRRRIELQIRAVVVPYRIERRRRDSLTMDKFRARARSILDGLEEEARPYPELEARLVEARRELESGQPLKRAPNPAVDAQSSKGGG